MFVVGIIAAAGIIAVAAVLGVIGFINLPKDAKIKNVKEWLKYAVVEAEKQFGSKTGVIKLRAVYDKAISKFPFIASFVSFEKFGEWVDEALEWMKSSVSEVKTGVQNYLND